MVRVSLYLLLFFITVNATAAASVDDCARSFGSLGIKRNSQIVIWELDASGRHRAAERLRKEATESLKNSDIAKPEADSGRIDMGDLTFLEFTDGRKGVWKTWSEEYGNSKRQVMREVTAYKFDRLIGADIVPITVPRNFNGRPGVVQLFVRDVDDAKLVPNPNYLKLFDFLLANEDRIATNHLTREGRTIAIDNENTFMVTEGSSHVPDFVGYIRTRLDLVEKSGGSALEKAKAANEIAVTLISKDVVDKLRSLSNTAFRRALSELNPTEFTAFLERKNRALAVIAEAEKVLGSSIYPAGRFSALSRDTSVQMRERIRQYLNNRHLPRALRKPAEAVMKILGSADQHNRHLTEEEAALVKQTMRDIEGD